MFWPFRRSSVAENSSLPDAIIDTAPRRFVIPDIHGCSRTFRALIEDVIVPDQEDSLYLLGDYIDRGPNSKEVLDYLMELKTTGYKLVPLRGNHEEMFLSSCKDRDNFRTWIINGGYAALDSFGVDDPCEVPIHYRRFCEGLHYYQLLDDFLLVHAGFNTNSEDPFADLQTMLWTRTRSINRAAIGGRTMICGHTPHPLKDIEKMIKKNSGVIILDNGCFLAGQSGMGNLMALELNSMTLYSQKNIDMPERER